METETKLTHLQKLVRALPEGKDAILVSNAREPALAHRLPL